MTYAIMTCPLLLLFRMNPPADLARASCADKLFDSIIGSNKKLRQFFVVLFVSSLVAAIIALSISIW